MTKGVLGVIACPMLEDELVFSLNSDLEGKTIYVVDNQHANSFKRKMDKNNISYTDISESQFFGPLKELDRDTFNIVILMNTLGLHEEPKDLRSVVEEQVMKSQDGFDALMLYYGTCGNHGWDISKWAAENGLKPVTIFRDENGKICDDCIGVAVGGCEQYFNLLKKYTGMLFLTPNMATSWDPFSKSMELFKGTDTTNEENMRELFRICGYKYAVKIDTGLGDQEDFQKCAEKVSKSMNLELIYADDSWPCLEPTNRIYSESKSYLRD